MGTRDSLDGASILTPTGLVRGEEYFLAGGPADPILQKVRALLEWASPYARCVGEGEKPPPATTVVLFQPSCFSQAAEMLESGLAAAGRIRFLPIPADYPWAFWAVWGWYEDRPDLLDRLTSLDAYQHFFRRCNYLGGERYASMIQNWNSLAIEGFYWEDSRAYIRDHDHDYARVLAGLADDRSRQAYSLALHSDPKELWVSFVSTVFGALDYLAHDWPGPGETVLDLGVFSGHELPYLLTMVGDKGAVHAIDPLGLDLLSEYASQFAKHCPNRLHSVRIAAGARYETASFSRYPDGQLCRTSVEDPAEAHQCAVQPLDDYVESARLQTVSFIKMDIEGMEPEALAGLSRTLRRTRPTLSLAIYHTPEQLWSLPLRLMNDLDGYDFYIDHGSPFKWETVLTAVPRERRGRR
jgi:FkbM family methyltransferase